MSKGLDSILGWISTATDLSLTLGSSVSSIDHVICLSSIDFNGGLGSAMGNVLGIEDSEFSSTKLGIVGELCSFFFICFSTV